MSVNFFVNLSICQFVNLLVCQFVNLSICQYINLSICLKMVFDEHVITGIWEVKIPGTVVCVGSGES